MRIVQLANFWTPTSGGLRVVLDHLARGYAARGHAVCQIVPGGRDGHHLHPWGRRTTVAAPTLPGTGYRVIVRLRHVERLVEAFGADVIEVSDRATLARVAARFRHRRVRTVLVAHERLDHILPAGSYYGLFDSSITRRVADGWNPRCVAGVDDVVVPSRFGAEEWERVGVAPRVVPWGVDTERFHPGDDRTRPTGSPDRALDLVWVGRLAPEKRPTLAIETTRTLVALGVDVRLTVVGDGPLAETLRDEAADAPVRFQGHVSDHTVLRDLLAEATASLSTSGIEAFGLAVLESMACGTPVVACRGGAAGDVAGAGGRVVAPTPDAIAAGVQAVAAEPSLRETARRRALRFGWDATVDAMIEVHHGRVRERAGAWGRSPQRDSA